MSSRDRRACVRVNDRLVDAADVFQDGVSPAHRVWHIHPHSSRTTIGAAQPHVGQRRPLPGRDRVETIALGSF